MGQAEGAEKYGLSMPINATVGIARKPSTSARCSFGDCRPYASNALIGKIRADVKPVLKPVTPSSSATRLKVKERLSNGN
jgi:hypothetical protein